MQFSRDLIELAGRVGCVEAESEVPSSSRAQVQPHKLNVHEMRFANKSDRLKIGACLGNAGSTLAKAMGDLPPLQDQSGGFVDGEPADAEEQAGEASGIYDIASHRGFPFVELMQRMVSDACGIECQHVCG